MTLAALALPPRLWVTDPHGERRVTWMELFFDLIFVAAVAQVGAPLAKDYGWTGLLRYGFLFVLIWWAWSGHTLYSTRFDHDDLVHRILILIQCFIAAVMAANAKEALDSGPLLASERPMRACASSWCCSTYAHGAFLRPEN